MARYIQSFENDTAIQNAVKYGDLLKPYVAYNEDLDIIDWNTKEAGIDYSKEYFTIEALETGNLYFSIGHLCYYSINGLEWTTVNYNINISVQAGDKIRVKSGSLIGGSDISGDLKDTSFTFNLYGNMGSLFYGDDFTTIDYSTAPTRNIASFLRNCKVVNAKNLIIPTWSFDSGVMYMFSGCTSLITAPEIPSTMYDKNRGCYGMFAGCTSLTEAPVLTPTILGYNTFAYMFDGCTSLNYIKCLAPSISSSFTSSWVRNVAATGTFVKASGVSWPTGNDGIPRGWTVIEE